MTNEGIIKSVTNSTILVDAEYMHEALNLARKDEAIGFQDWIDLKGYYHYTSNDLAWFENDGELIANTTEELYNEFKREP